MKTNLRKPQNTKKWQIDGNNNREDDMKGREMEYMSAREFSKNLGQWIRKHNRTKYSWAEKMGLLPDANVTIFLGTQLMKTR